MLIAAAPTAIPVSTANVPTESVASEVAQKTPVQEPKPTTDSPGSRNSTENNEQSRNPLDLSRQPPGEKSSQDEQSQQQNKQQQQAAEAREVEQLKQVDREVRAHEQAHTSVGGELAGAPQFSFEIGPDGNRYAVAGEVSIDTSRVANDPQATVEKMLQVRQAALAPVNPSTQDFKVAAIASQIANQAQIELNVEQQDSQQTQGPSVTISDRASEDVDSDDIFVGDDVVGDDLESRDETLAAINPFSARRAASALNAKIANSGALDDSSLQPLFSQTA